MKYPNVKKIFYPRSVDQEDEKPLRVCAYCRVSTKSNDQLKSYDTQMKVYRQRISEEPGWVFAGIYSDKGLTGTNAKSRPGFLHMVFDCEKGLIDCIICKSISRFSRNTLDAINYIRHLRDLGIRLIMEKEGIDTANDYSDMLLTVLAAFSQEESRSISENIKWGKRKKLENGEPLLLPCYGYRKNVVGDNYDIVPKEAEGVRLLFDMYEHGMAVPMIAKILMEKGYPMPDGRLKVWDRSRIRYIITNEKYVGDIITQKYYQKSFLDYRTYRNKGVLPSVYIKDHHPAIISRHQFERCNMILNLKKRTTPLQYPFGEYLKCPYCGYILHHRRLEIQNVDSHYCCEGEGACRGFVIMAHQVERAILSAYESIEIEDVKNHLQKQHGHKVEDAELLINIKAEHPAFTEIHYWWLDDLVESISFGMHSRNSTELTSGIIDDRTITIIWRCGMVTTVPSGVIRDSDDPKHKAKLWNSFILRYPERYPKLAEEIAKMQQRND